MENFDNSKIEKIVEVLIRGIRRGIIEFEDTNGWRKIKLEQDKSISGVFNFCYFTYGYGVPIEQVNIVLDLNKENKYYDNYITREEFNKLSNPQKNNEEVKEEYWPNGKLRFKYSYKNGKLHGLCEWWYKNGNLSSRHNYKDGKPHGICELWNIDGTLVFKQYYFNNEPVTEEEFNKLSNPQKNNEEVKEEYWPNGNLKYRYNYKNGKGHGLCKEYYENGNLESTYNYKNGEWYGLCEEWWENGSIACQIYYWKNIRVDKKEFDRLQKIDQERGCG